MTMLATLVAAALLSTAPPDQGAPGDVERIRAHLERVERALRSADVSAFDAQARVERAHLLDVLHAYRERGQFPHNHVLDHRNPVFIDPHGTPCAVGHLIIESGAREVALEISRSQNLAYLKDITHPAVAPWAKAHGFTLDELARIQPSYDSCQFKEVCVIPRSRTELRAVVRLTEDGSALESSLEVPAEVTVLAAAQAHDGSGAWVLLSNGDVMSRDAHQQWTPRQKVPGATGLAVLDAQHVVVLFSDRTFATLDATTGERTTDLDQPADAKAVLAVARGELWVATPTGTFRKRVAKPWQRMGPGGAALSGTADDVWVTTVDGGAWHYDGATVEDVSFQGHRLESLLSLGDGRAAALCDGSVRRFEPGQGWAKTVAIPAVANDQTKLVTQAEQLRQGPTGELLLITGDGAVLRERNQDLSPLELPTSRLVHGALALGSETLLFVQSADATCDRYEHPCGACDTPGSCRGGALSDEIRRPPLPCSAAGSAWSWAAVAAGALFSALHRRRRAVVS
ncbi:MAG: hypothetical protein K1X89_27330 [Myxococcaceae bacterium]|nr:hypothetical protein [Myxococcaceae bacterium]